MAGEGLIDQGLVSGIVKEMLDWYNFGLSFVLGLICIWAYKKTGHLLAPILGNGDELTYG